MTIWEIIYWPFAQLMKLCLFISFDNYMFALLFFALIMQIVLLPLAIKQHKGMVMQKKMRPKELAIRKKYAGRTDRATQQKMTLEIQDMYKNEGYNQFASCLPMLLQLPIILILFAIVRAPIQYSSTSDAMKNDLSSGKLYSDAVEYVKDYKDKSLYEGSDENYNSYQNDLNKVLAKLSTTQDEATKEYVYNVDSKSKDQLLLTKIIVEDKEYFQNLAKTRDLTFKQDAKEIPGFSQKYKEALPDFNFFGETLLDTPTLSLNLLLLISILVFVTSYYSGVINRKIMGAPVGAENNPMANGWFMKWGMPLMSLYFSFQMPAAVGIYWIWRTIFGGVQPVILNHFYPMPEITEEEIAAAEKEFNKKVKKKKKVIMIEVDEDDETYKDMEVNGKTVSNTGGKKKMMVNNIEMLSADDDDDEETEDDNPENGKK